MIIVSVDEAIVIVYCQSWLLLVDERIALNKCWWFEIIHVDHWRNRNDVVISLVLSICDRPSHSEVANRWSWKAEPQIAPSSSESARSPGTRKTMGMHRKYRWCSGSSGHSDGPMDHFKWSWNVQTSQAKSIQKLSISWHLDEWLAGMSYCTCLYNIWVMSLKKITWMPAWPHPSCTSVLEQSSAGNHQALLIATFNLAIWWFLEP